MIGKPEIIKTPKRWPKLPLDTTFETPYRSRQVRGHIISLSAKKNLDLAVRVAFRKISKGLDNQNAKLAAAETKLETISKSQLQAKDARRKAIEKDPNSLFSNISNIIRTRAQMKAALQLEDNAKEVEQQKFDSMCHSWSILDE